MRRFDSVKFKENLVNLRGRDTQQVFADKLGINRSTLSLLENGKQLPSLDVLNHLCNLGNMEINDFFYEENDDPFILLMGSFKEEDKEKMIELEERIRLKERYAALARRCSNDR